MVLQSDRIGSRPGFSVLSMILSEDRLSPLGSKPEGTLFRIMHGTAGVR
jgi:hypothetical protein